MCWISSEEFQEWAVVAVLDPDYSEPFRNRLSELLGWYITDRPQFDMWLQFSLELDEILNPGNEER
jgi:hypothetical protein